MLPAENREEGFTLIEVLMALIVLGIGVSALMVAMGTQIKTTLENRNQAAAAAFLTTASEYVKSAVWNPTVSGGTCAPISSDTAFPTTTRPTPPTGFTATYSDGQSVPSASPCEVQRITIDVNGFDYDLQIDVLKRAQTEVAP